MRIIRLEASNFKKLVAVAIEPGAHLVEVTGDNGAGKTSCLDAIWALVGGKDAAPDKPIRTGEQQAVISAELGDGDEVKLKVTRKFKLREGVPYTTDLIVESGEGARFSSPQGILDALVGSLCFDPLAFTRMKDEEQIKALRAFVPEVNFTEIEGLNRRDYEERTEVNRKVRDYRAQAGALPTYEGDLPELVDIPALENKLAEAANHNSDVERRRTNREAAEQRIAAIATEIAALDAEAKNLAQQLEQAPALPDLIDIEGTRKELSAGREQNELVERVRRRLNLEETAQAGEEAAAVLTQKITTRTEEMAKAVAAAKMPVPGLSFLDGAFVTLGGEPLAQASQAEKIRVSVAIAAAMNPQLRVARILDGSLLDAKSWDALAHYAAEADLQIWIETVSQHGAAAVHIADGGVVADMAGPVPPVAEVGDVV